jgi:hypothetical protein
MLSNKGHEYFEVTLLVSVYAFSLSLLGNGSVTNTHATIK